MIERLFLGFFIQYPFIDLFNERASQRGSVVFTNLPKAGFELGSLGPQASVLPV